MCSLEFFNDQLPSCSNSDRSKEESVLVSERLDDSRRSRFIHSTSTSPSSPSSPPSSTVLFPRWMCSLILFVSFLGSTLSTPRCFTAGKGFSINGGEYRRLLNTNLKECQVNCREESSCLAYEWREESNTCFLKARSLSGDMARKENIYTGFCIDDEDGFLDHEITGPVVTFAENIEFEECKDFCKQALGTMIYSWRPDEPDNDEGTLGKCSCLESIRGLHLSYNSLSGFFPPKPITPHRLKFRK
ncbi:unnamed protein product, partial [Mesorhabditis belari]|uniref:Apple domain-containing protein n=1 Tax=Mesorhabditis belari TaxID=2138241 RepID=A0AAF3F4U9_9BILA